MERNAWTVAKEVQLRINDEKGPANDFLKCYVTEQVEEQFFFNKDELLQYCSVSISKKHTVPGHIYFDEIFKFVRDHVEIGELYIEYKKGSCEIYAHNKCDYCAKAPKIIQCPILPVRIPSTTSKITRKHSLLMKRRNSENLTTSSQDIVMFIIETG